MKIAFISLGCSKNLINTEQMMALCKAAGHQVTGEPEGADVAVLNTCGFIDAAKSEAIEHIIALGELKQAGKLGKLLVCGCLSQRYPEEIKKDLPEVDGLMGTGSYDQIVSAVEAVAKGENPDLFGDISATSEEGERLVTTPGYTAFLKIAEGCDNFCAFCIIPYLRGRYRSRPMEAILQEAKELADAGVKELILIAQDIGPYGKDLYGERKLSELLRQLCKLPFHWIRLHYLYPDHFDDEVIRVIASQPRIVKYLDIPLQHCSDRLLKSMNRWGTKESLTTLLQNLREKIPGLVLRTSLICGLPGETEEDFEDLCQFVTETGIERAGVFQYSREEGTRAAEMPDQVPEEVAQQRVDRLIELQSRVLDEYNESRLGTVMEVLCEGFDNEMGCYVGRTYADSVEVDGHVYFTAAGLVPAGTFVNVRMTGTEDGDLTGEVEE
ncbi:MAG: 30S ribosomal protein S12 methylthiotransferase RimO [Oscillospiraceae bacterium]|nr:30S ribosomal protein S12 methylthiotransferase RimO [Oscillospiraceae bacterium]